MTATAVCVLGASGFLGSHLSAELVRQGYRVHAFDKVVPENPLIPVEQRHNFIPFPGDFFNAEDLKAALSGCSCCFHLIATTLPKSSNENPARDVRQNIEGTLNLLDLALKEGVRKVVFSSSGGTVYGTPQTRIISEEHPTDPLCSYGISKLAIEKYLALYNELHGLEYSVLRIANPYGKLQRIDASQGLIGVFLGKVLCGEPLEVWGDGSIVRDYLHAGDVAKAFVLASQRQTESHVFNIGSGNGFSINDIIHSIGIVTGKTIPVAYKEGRPFDVSYSVLDISRAQKELGWNPLIALEDGLRETWEWILHTQACTEKGKI